MTFTPGDSSLSHGGYEDASYRDLTSSHSGAGKSLQGRKVTVTTVEVTYRAKLPDDVPSPSSPLKEPSSTLGFTAAPLAPTTSRLSRIAAIGKSVLLPLSSMSVSPTGETDALSTASTRALSHRTDVSTSPDSLSLVSHRRERASLDVRPVEEDALVRSRSDLAKIVRTLNDMHDDIDGLLHDDAYTPEAHKVLQKLKTRTQTLKEFFLPLVMSSSSHPHKTKIIKQSIDEILTLKVTYEKTLDEVQKMKKSSSLPLAYEKILPELSKCHSQVQAVHLFTYLAKAKGEEPNLKHMKEQVQRWMDEVEAESHVKGYPFAQKKALLEEEIMLSAFKALLKSMDLWR